MWKFIFVAKIYIVPGLNLCFTFRVVFYFITFRKSTKQNIQQKKNREVKSFTEIKVIYY